MIGGIHKIPDSKVFYTIWSAFQPHFDQEEILSGFGDFSATLA